MSLPRRAQWYTNDQGWCVTTVEGVFIALMRERETSWRWLGFANGHPLGRFDGLTRAKREAVPLAKEYAR